MLCLILLVSPGLLSAGQARDNSTAGGLNVSVDLRHRVVIPQILYLRIGSDGFGDVDKLNFDVAPGGAGVGNNQTYSGSLSVPIGDGTPISATNGSLPVQIMGNVGSLTLSYDLSDPLGLSDGAGNYVPFDEINVVSADPGSIPAPALSNAGTGGAVSVSITGNLFGGRVVQRSTTWTYTYRNNQVLRAGTYTGSVRYTLSAP